MQGAYLRVGLGLEPICYLISRPTLRYAPYGWEDAAQEGAVAILLLSSYFHKGVSLASALSHLTDMTVPWGFH